MAEGAARAETEPTTRVWSPSYDAIRAALAAARDGEAVRLAHRRTVAEQSTTAAIARQVDREAALMRLDALGADLDALAEVATYGVPASDLLAFARSYCSRGFPDDEQPAQRPAVRYTVVVNPRYRDSGWDVGVRINDGSVPNGSGWCQCFTKSGALRWARRWVRRQERLDRRRGLEQQVHP